MEVIIVTGMAGAGKSSVLKILEDLGYYAMDNLPAELIIDFANLTSKVEIDISRIAVGLDVRSIQFQDVIGELNKLEATGFDVKILYLETKEEVLVQRYKENRRPHPMEKTGNLLEGIANEKKHLSDIKARADYIINTTNLKLSDLKSRVAKIFGEDVQANLVISVVSFGFKNGILLDADLVFDVRFLPNPHYIDELRPMNGKDSQVSDYVFSFNETNEYIGLLMNLLNFSIPLYVAEGKSNLVIGIGCTGGKHRSVAIAEHLAAILENNYNLVFANHRDERYW